MDIKKKNTIIPVFLFILFFVLSVTQVSAAPREEIAFNGANEVKKYQKFIASEGAWKTANIMKASMYQEGDELVIIFTTYPDPDGKIMYRNSETYAKIYKKGGIYTKTDHPGIVLNDSKTEDNTVNNIRTRKFVYDIKPNVADFDPEFDIDISATVMVVNTGDYVRPIGTVAWENKTSWGISDYDKAIKTENLTQYVITEKYRAVNDASTPLSPKTETKVYKNGNYSKTPPLIADYIYLGWNETGNVTGTAGTYTTGSPSVNNVQSR